MRRRKGRRRKEEPSSRERSISRRLPTSLHGSGYRSHAGTTLHSPTRRTQRFEEWRLNAGVLIASWSRFKGLEADAIVIIETQTKDKSHVNANRYVARSRAKHLLTVIEVEQ
jgi:hypothetical protein